LGVTTRVGLSAISFYSVIPAKTRVHNKKDAASIPNAKNEYEHINDIT